MSYLFGSIITVPVADLLALAGLAVLLIAVTLRHYNGFVAMPGPMARPASDYPVLAQVRPDGLWGGMAKGCARCPPEVFSSLSQTLSGAAIRRDRIRP